MATYDTTAWLADVRQRARAPAGAGSGWADADLLRAGNDELLSVLVPELMQLNEDFFTTPYSVAFTAGQDAYSIPSRAALGKVRSVERIDSDGRAYTLTKYNLEQVGAVGGSGTDQATPLVHRFERNKLVVYPVPDGNAGTLRLRYFRRPSRLVSAATTSVGVVSAIGATTITLTTTKPTSMATGVRVDLIGAAVPFEPLADDLVLTGASGTGLTFAAGALPAALAVGDYVALSEESPVWQLPIEFFAILAQRVANQVLRGGTDKAALDDGVATLAKMEAPLLQAAQVRSEGSGDFIIQRGLTWSRFTRANRFPYTQ